MRLHITNREKFKKPNPNKDTTIQTGINAYEKKCSLKAG